MNKRKIITLTAGCLLGLSCTAFAANIFEDVPTDHWAYKSIEKLSKDGIVDGYKDGEFRGSQTLTRYEMATIVANAITKEAKVNAEDKAEIEKLKNEFSEDLQEIGIRTTKLETRMDKAEKIQFKIAAREIYGYVNSPISKNNSVDHYYHYRFFMTTNLDENAKFIGMVENSDETTNNNVNSPNGASQGGNFTAKQAYLRANIGQTTWNLGRQPFSWLGNGLVCDNSGKWDGVTGEFGINSKFYIRAGVADRVISQQTHTFYMANAKYVFNPSFNLVSVYLKDNGIAGGVNSYNDTTSIGFNYSLGKYSLMGEFAKNRANMAQLANGNKAAMGQYLQLQYNKNDQEKIGTWDVFINYRKADPGFDLQNYTTLDSFNGWGVSGGANNVKGPGLVGEYVPFKHTVLSLRAFRLKDESKGNKDYNAYMVRMDYNY